MIPINPFFRTYHPLFSWTRYGVQSPMHASPRKSKPASDFAINPRVFEFFSQANAWTSPRKKNSGKATGCWNNKGWRKYLTLAGWIDMVPLISPLRSVPLITEASFGKPRRSIQRINRKNMVESWKILWVWFVFKSGKLKSVRFQKKNHPFNQIHWGGSLLETSQIPQFSLMLPFSPDTPRTFHNLDEKILFPPQQRFFKRFRQNPKSCGPDVSVWVEKSHQTQLFWGSKKNPEKSWPFLTRFCPPTLLRNLHLWKSLMSLIHLHFFQGTFARDDHSTRSQA